MAGRLGAIMTRYMAVEKRKADLWSCDQMIEKVMDDLREGRIGAEFNKTGILILADYTTTGREHIIHVAGMDATSVLGTLAYATNAVILES